MTLISFQIRGDPKVSIYVTHDYSRVLSHSESHPFKLSSGIVPVGRSVYGLGTSNGDGNVTVKFESKWELTTMSCIH